MGQILTNYIDIQLKSVGCLFKKDPSFSYIFSVYVDPLHPSTEIHKGFRGNILLNETVKLLREQ